VGLKCLAKAKEELTMPLLQMRDVPEDLYETLSESARIDKRSIDQQAVSLLRTALSAREERAFRRRAIFQEIDAMSLKNAAQFPAPADLLCADRTR
jgi:plasmid stability protein